ncbi:PDLI2 protein, partial [Circaetus pectoralis]|nr:PDLI2 protein [Circaetus pectoralis]
MPVMVTLAGPAPWGFRITGGRDFGKPITVSKVTEQGKAAAGDLRPGDVIVAINGESAAEMLNVEAQNKIKQSPGQLRLQVERSPMPPPSHTNGDTSPERLATRFQVSPGQPPHTLAPHPGLISAAGISPLEKEFACPSLRQVSREPGGLYARGAGPGCPGAGVPPPPPKPVPGCPRSPHPSPPRFRAAAAPQGTAAGSEVGVSLLSSLPAFFFLVFQAQIGKRAGPAVPFPSRLSPSARKPVAGVQKLHVCEKCGSTIATQAVRIQDGRYRHPSCYACADCGLNLKMRGHFWVGDELYCEKHARLRYQGTLGGPANPPVSPHS